MILLRTLIGLIGVALIGMGVHALILSFGEAVFGSSFMFHSIDAYFIKIFGAYYVQYVPENIRAILYELPAFFGLVLVGVLLGWIGFRSNKRNYFRS